MNPSLLFNYSNCKIDIESAENSDDQITINFSTNVQGVSKGYVRLNEEETRQLMEWLQKQLAVIKSKKK